jgi:hypothetical protein
MLLRKLVGIKKETITMEQYITKVKDIINQLKEICKSYFSFTSFFKEYWFFSNTQLGRDELLTFLELEPFFLVEAQCKEGGRH